MNALPSSTAPAIAAPVCPSAVPAEAPNFDHLAPLYRWMEWLSFGPFLMRARCAFLSNLAQSRRALVLGDGDGRFTASLLRANRQIEIDALDISPAMLRGLRHRAGTHAARLRTEVQDIRRWTPRAGGPAYDVVVTHFFLDCLTTDEICALAARLRPALAPDARWMVSEFAAPASLFGKLVAGPIIAFLYWAFRLLTGLSIRRLPDYCLALTASGFTLVSERRRLGGLLVSQLWSPQPEATQVPL